MSQYLPLVILAFLAAFVTTPLVGRVASRTGFVDEPQPHKMHVRPMPLLGGLAIYLALCIALFIALFRVNLASDMIQMVAIAVGATLLMLVGMWDDRRGIAPRAKLLAQVAAALIVAAAGVRVDILPWPVVNFLITIFWFVGISNAINLMDNMDGLAAGTSAISALFFTILAASAGQGLVASLAAAVAGASLGFLYYNISPAMIFMGDTGSLLLGFLLAVIGIKYSPLALPLGSTWMIPIVVLGLPVFDTTLVTFSRLLAHRPVSQGGTDHTSHRLARMGLGINRAVLTMYILGAALGVSAVFMTQSSPQTATVLFAALLGAGLAGLFILERARPIPSTNPKVVILAEDDQARAAIRAARGVSSQLAVVVSPRADPSVLRAYLRELALAPEAFSRWLDSAAGGAVGPAETWSEVFHICGKVILMTDDAQTERWSALLRESNLIVVCRGKGWPKDIRALLSEFRGRSVLAPEADLPGTPALSESQWNDPAALLRALEDTLLGARRKERTS
jgi:UDP-GlcNAc:undecaprenyl-phosphate/decaprenyl-phosphate GlcNAc-1-phosphate transferase